MKAEAFGTTHWVVNSAYRVAGGLSAISMSGKVDLLIVGAGLWS
jgi:hypothetical protein